MKEEKGISPSDVQNTMFKLGKSLKTMANLFALSGSKHPFGVSIEEVKNNSIDSIFLLPPSNNKTQNWISKKRLKSLYDKLKDSGTLVCFISGIGSMPKLTSYAENLGFQISCCVSYDMFILEKAKKKKLLKKDELKHILVVHDPFMIQIEMK